MSQDTTKPLAGKRVVVTRTREQASELADKLSALGADVLQLPVISITQDIEKNLLADVMLELGSYDWLVFTSGNGVKHFFQVFLRLFDDIRSLGLMRIACVGESTARRIAEYHLKVECQPKVATAEALADALVATGSLDSAKILVITGNLNRDTLVTKLEEARAIVDQFQVYTTAPVDLSENPAAQAYRREGADAVLFASSSSALYFAEQAPSLRLGPNARKPLYGSIGPQTSASMKASKLSVDFVASTPGLDPLVEATVKALSQ